MQGQQSSVFSSVLSRVEPLDVYKHSMQGSGGQSLSAHSPSQSLFPANIVHEGHDQHARWFLTSLVSSVALTGQAPFANLKTHGMVLNDKGVKMSKADMRNRESLVDPTDLIAGTVKLDGSRSHGYGLDTVRLWAITKDSDKDTFLEREELERVNQDVRTLRGLIRILLGNLHSYDASAQPFDFSKLTFLDKIMACKLLKFTVQVTDAYERLDLKQVQELAQDFLARELSDFYLTVSRERLLMREGTPEHLSAQMVYSKVLLTVL